MRKIATVGIALLIQNAAFVTICVALNPVNEFVGIVYILWMTIPALTAAILSVNHSWYGIAAVIASIVSVTCWSYLLLGKGLFWDESVSRAGLAIAYLIVGLVIGVVCAGFVQVVIDAVESAAIRGETSRMLAGMKKGVVFGGVCSLVVAILVFLIGGGTVSGRGPEAQALREEISRQTEVVSFASLIVGTFACTLLGALIGRIRQNKQFPIADLDNQTSG
jgi:hypothetical protein